MRLVRCFCFWLAFLACAVQPALASEPSARPRPSTPFDETIAAVREAMFGDPNEALRLATEARSLAGDDPSALATVSWLRAAALLRLQRPHEARDAIEEAKSHLPENEARLCGDVLLTDARISKALGDVGASLIAFEKAHAHFSESGYRRGEAMALNGIAILYLDAQRFGKAIEYFERSTAAFDEDPRLTMSANNYRALAFQAIGDIDSAEEALLTNEAFAEATGQPMLLAIVYGQLAELYLAREDYAAAERYLGEAARFDDDPNARIWRRAIDEAEAQLAIAEGRTGDARVALARIFEGYDFAEPDPMLDSAHRTAHAFYRSVGETETALRHLEAFLELDSEAARAAAEKDFALLSAQFEASAKDLEIERLRNATLTATVNAAREKERLRDLVIATVTLGAAMTMSLLLWHLRSVRRAADELEEKNVELGEAIEAKSQFLARTSHEIRTPLNAIIGMTDVMLADPALPVETQQRLRTVDDSGRMLLSIVDDILDVAKMEREGYELRTGPVDVAAAVSGLVALHRANGERKGVSVEAKLPGDASGYVTDERLLKQAVGNLLNNAVKFTEEGAVTVSVEPRADGFAVTVEDTGIGVPSDQLGAIFESFRQVDGSATRRFGGTGLGLAIVRNIADLLGGEVSAESTLGEGSRFTLCVPAPVAALPAAPAREAEAELGQARQSSASQRRLRVLLAEDNKVNQLVVTSLIAKDVACLDLAEDGAEALRMVQEADYDLVLMDNQMPVMSGTEATRAIRALPGEAGRIAIIGVTADVAGDMQQQLLEAGMDAVVPKPVTRQRLMEAIAGLFAGRSAASAAG